MITITIAGEVLDLYPNTNISIELNNPAVADTVADGSYSYPFELPSTDRNRRILGFGYMPDNAVTPKQWTNAVVTIEGAWRIEGVLNLVYPMSDRNYRVNLNITSVLQSLNTIQLSDLVQPITLGATLGEWVNGIHKINNDTDASVAFPIIDTEKHIRSLASSAQIFGSEGRMANFINYYIMGAGTSIPTAHDYDNAFQPWLKVVNLLHSAAQRIGVSFTGEIFTDTELKEIIVTNDRAHTITVSSTTSVPNIEPTPTTLQLPNFAPNMTVLQLLTALRTLFGINLYADFNGFTTRSMRTVLSTAVTADWTPYRQTAEIDLPLSDTPLQFSHNWADATYADYIQKRLHILIRSEDQAPAGSWFRAFFEGDVSTLPPNNGSLSTARLWYNTTDGYFYGRISATAYHKVKINLLGSVANLPNLPAVSNMTDTGKCYWVDTFQHYYVCLAQYLNGFTTYEWFRLCDVPDTVTGATNGTTVQAPLCAIDDGDTWNPRRFNAPNYNNERFCVLKNHFAYQPHDSEKTERSFVAIWRGMQKGTGFGANGTRYAQAAGRNFSFLGSGTLVDHYNYSLLWSGDKGLYMTWHEAWQTIRTQSPVFTAQMRLPIAEVINFKFYEKVRIGNQNYIITKIAMTASLNGLGICEVSGVRV